MEYWKKAAIITALGQFSDAADTGVIMMAIPILIALMHLGPIEVGWLGGAFTFGTATGGLISGPLVDIVGRKKIWCAGNIIAGISYFASTISTNWVMLAIFRYIAGFTVGSCYAAYFALIPEEMPPDKRATISGLSFTLNTCGILLCSTMLALTAFYPWITWQFMVMVVGAVDLFVGLLGIVMLREPPIWLERRRLLKEGKLPKEKQAGLKTVLNPEVRKKFIIAELVGMSFGFATLVGLGGGGGTFYQATMLKFDAFTIGMIGNIGTVVNVILVALTGAIADKKGRLKTILTIGLVSLVTGQLMLYTPYIVGVGTSLIVVAFYFIMYQLWQWSARPLEAPTRVWIAETVPTSIRGFASGMTDFLKSLISSIGSVVAGYFAAAVGLAMGYALPLLIGNILALIFVGIALKAGLETRGKVLEA